MDKAQAEAKCLGVPTAFEVGEGQDHPGFARCAPLNDGHSRAQGLKVLHRALHVGVAEGLREALDLQAEFPPVDAGGGIERQHQFDGDRNVLRLGRDGQQQ